MAEIGVVAAVATGGALAIVCASLGAAMTVLQQSGAQDKMYDAMGASAGIAQTAHQLIESSAWCCWPASITNAGMLAKGVGERV